VDRERDVVEHNPPVGYADPEPVHLEHNLVGDRGLPGLRGGELAPHHQLGEVARSNLPWLNRGDCGSPPDHSDLVGDRQDLVQLVGDEDDGDALGLEPAQVVKELIDLLGHEHGCWLVQDQRLSAAVDDLENLDALSVTDAEVLDQ
jgi:hypothetical protein